MRGRVTVDDGVFVLVGKGVRVFVADSVTTTVADAVVVGLGVRLGARGRVREAVGVCVRGTGLGPSQREVTNAITTSAANATPLITTRRRLSCAPASPIEYRYCSVAASRRQCDRCLISCSGCVDRW